MYLQLGVVFATLFQIAVTETCFVLGHLEKCVTPNNEEAECVSIYSCKILIDTVIDAFFKTGQSESIEFARKSKCGRKESDHMVCCGSTSRFSAPMVNKTADKEKLIPDRRYCGYQHSDDYFRNETAIAINEFPWLAGLIYEDGNILCSGSLISNRYVLTAAHCIIRVKYELVGVRLGEYNTKTDEDCTEDLSFYECSEPPQNFDIEKIIPYPQYTRSGLRGVHDIGLLRLSKRVQYSDYIRPICLPTAGTMFAKPGDILLTSGWGIKQAGGKQTDIKKRISSKLITNEECRASHWAYERINENHLCSQEPDNTTEYFCSSGDIGGPAMFSFRNQWHQEGVASLIDCHLGFPVVYTKVVNYLDWIKENIEP